MGTLIDSVSPNAAPSVASPQTQLRAYGPADAAASIRAELRAAPGGGATWRAMEIINDPQWSPTQRGALLRDLQSDGTLTGMINTMYMPPSTLGGNSVPANERRDFFVSLAKNTTATGLMATQEAISMAAGAPGLALQATEDLARAVATHATDVTKANFVRDVAGAALPAAANAAGVGHRDVGGMAAAIVLPTIESPAQFSLAMRGLAGDALPAVLRRVAGLRETDAGVQPVPGATSGIDGLMTRVAELGAPELSAAVLRAATVSQPADQRGVADALALAASRLLTETPSANGMTGPQQIVDQLFGPGDGADVIGRLMAGLAAGGHHDTAMTLARGVFTNVGVEVNREFRNAQLAGFFEEATDVGTNAYDAQASDERSSLLGYFSSLLQLPGGAGVSVAVAGLEAALNGRWDSADAARRDEFVAAVHGASGLDGAAASDADAPSHSPGRDYLMGVGVVAARDNGPAN